MLKIKPSKTTRPPAQRAPPQAASDQPPAKKPRPINHSSILITREASANPSEDLDILLGNYAAIANRLNHGMVVYKKVPGADDEDSVFLYFFRNTEGERGWWLGPEVNGAEAYCWAPSVGFPPPVSGWRIPTDDQPAVEDLRVIYPAPATGQAEPEAALVETPIEDEVNPCWNLLKEVPEANVRAEIEKMASFSSESPQPETVPPIPPSRPLPAPSVRAEIERLKALKTSLTQPSQPKTVPPPKAKGVEESSAPAQAASVRAKIERLKAASRQPKTVAPPAKPVAVEPAEVDRFRLVLGKVVTGVVKTFGDDMGVLSSEDFTGDLQVNKAGVASGLALVPGMKVSFKIRFRSQIGKAEAYEVKEFSSTTALPTVAAGNLRDAAISAGLCNEEAIWLDHFYQNRTLYWRIVNSTTIQTEDKQLAAAGKALIEIFPKGEREEERQE